jgi:hypothetical protein
MPAHLLETELTSRGLVPLPLAPARRVTHTDWPREGRPDAIVRTAGCARGGRPDAALGGGAAAAAMGATAAAAELGGVLLRQRWVG